jgi:hypothetical protein
MIRFQEDEDRLILKWSDKCLRDLPNDFLSYTVAYRYALFLRLLPPW